MSLEMQFNAKAQRRKGAEEGHGCEAAEGTAYSRPARLRTFSPSPCPSPSEGEGSRSRPARESARVGWSSDGRRGSLSQRERAGVRENGHKLAARVPACERDAVPPALSPLRLRVVAPLRLISTAGLRVKIFHALSGKMTRHRIVAAVRRQLTAASKSLRIAETIAPKGAHA